MKNHPQKTIIFRLMTSGENIVDLRSNLIEKRHQGMQRAFQRFFQFSSYYTFGDNSDYLRKIAIFYKKGLW